MSPDCTGDSARCSAKSRLVAGFPVEVGCEAVRDEAAGAGTARTGRGTWEDTAVDTGGTVARIGAVAGSRGATSGGTVTGVAGASGFG